VAIQDGAADAPGALFSLCIKDISMTTKLMKLYVFLQTLREEHGQDLIEYALVCALIALAATAGMSTVANYINNGFTSIGSKINQYTT
jgi:pilus assembly protein Flp/PilA